MTKYVVKVQHYGERIQTIPERYTRKWQAEKRLYLVAEILKGYAQSFGWVENSFIVFGEEGIYRTRLWVAREK